SPANSLVDAGSFAYGLPNGDYVVVGSIGTSPHTSPTATWVSGATGTTLDGQNVLDPQNSLIGPPGSLVNFGQVKAGPVSDSFVLGLSSGQVVIGFTNPNDLTYALAQGQTLAVTPDVVARTLDTGTSVTLQANDDLVVDSPITVTPSGSAGKLTLEAGR